MWLWSPQWFQLKMLKCYGMIYLALDLTFNKINMDNINQNIAWVVNILVNEDKY